MKLVRLATIELTRPAPTRLARGVFAAANGVPVTVDKIVKAEDVTDGPPKPTGGPKFVWPYEGDAARIAVHATVDCPVVDADADGLLAVPGTAAPSGDI